MSELPRARPRPWTALVLGLLLAPAAAAGSRFEEAGGRPANDLGAVVRAATGAPGDPRERAREELGAWPARDVVAALERRLDEEPGPSLELRLAAVEVLGELGSAHGLALLLEQAEGAGPLALRSPAVRRRVVASLAQLLARDPLACAELPAPSDDGGSGADRALEGVVVEALGASGRPEAVPLLLARLGGPRERDERAVEAAVGIAGELPWCVDATTRGALRDLLLHERWAVRRAAAVHLGRAHDAAAFDDLVDALGDAEPAVRAAAREGLAALTGTRTPADAEAWWRWHEMQAAWWSASGPRIGEQLASERPGDVVDAVRELGAHALFRDAGVAPLERALAAADPDVALGAARALGLLGSRLAVPALVDALERPDPALREAAGRSLVALTGRRLPAEAAAWRAELPE